METDTKVTEEPVHCNEPEKQEYKTKIVWFNVIFFVYLHFAAVYGFYLMFVSAKWKTLFFAFVLGNLSNLGITAGAHRLWSHQTYRSKRPLRIFLCLLNTIAFQNNIYEWCRDHRSHHKNSDTNGDPHNIKRGFFFAHMGWLMCKKHPDVTKNKEKMFLEDVLADPVVRFQRRYYFPMVFFFAFFIPTMIPLWCWGETAWNSFFIAAMARYCVCLNITWLVNSVAHKYGNQPYDKFRHARENPIVAFLTIGEGWHNYHHTFPWDYKASEMGLRFNLTTVFIDFMAMIGQAYNLKTADSFKVHLKKSQSGDNTSEKPQ